MIGKDDSQFMRNNNDSRHIQMISKADLMKFKQVNRENVLKIMEVHQLNEKLFNSSVGKNIVAVLGKTGSGKSTLINFLAGKELKSHRSDLILSDSADPEAMQIGTGKESETYLPKSIQVGDLLFYDFPGFGDTRGACFSLLNACYIKNILEKASSVRVVFVGSFDEILSERGRSFKELVKTSLALFDQNVENFSSIVINKCHKDDKIEDIIETIKEKIDTSSINSLLKCDSISKMTSREVINDERKAIYNTIQKIISTKIFKVDTSLIYDLAEKDGIRKIFETENNQIFNNIFEKKSADFSSANPNLNQLKKSLEYFEKQFISDFEIDLKKSKIINLIRPLAYDIYENFKKEFDNSIKIKLQNVVEIIKSKLKLKDEEEKRFQAEKKAKEEKKNRIQIEAEYENLKNELTDIRNKQRDIENNNIIINQKNEQLEKKIKRLSYRKNTNTNMLSKKRKKSVSNIDKFLKSVKEKKIKKQDLENDKLVKSLEKEELASLKKKELKYILLMRDQNDEGKKKKLLKKVIDYFKK
jgi:predicted GTPase